jgi:ABC-type transport system substrate-binding protein
MIQLTHSKRAYWLVALVSLLALVASACAAPVAPAPAVEGATPAPQEVAAAPAGDAELLRFGYGQVPNNFNPLTIIQGLQGFVQKWTNAKLITYDRNGNIIGDLAEEWSISDDGLVFNFKLREGVTWHDGEPFTADDVVFTFEHVLTREASARLYANFQIVEGAAAFSEGEADSISGIEVLSDHEIQITLSEPSAIFLVDLAIWGGLYILPEHVVSQIPAEGFATSEFATRRPYPGLGPYVFERYETDQFIELSANPDYYRGAPNIERVRFISIPDANTKIIALENGEVDLIEGVPVDELARVQNLPGIQLIQQPSPSGLGLFVESDQENDEPLKVAIRTPEFRQALYHALDIDTIISDVLNNVPTRSPCVFLQDWACSPDITIYDFDPDRARELLASIDWDPAWEVDWMILAQQVEPVHAIMQQLFADVGINMVPRTVDGPTFIENFYANGTFDVTMVGYGAGVDPNVPANNFFVCGQLYPNGFNGTRYCNDQVTELVALGKSTVDADARAGIYQELSLILNEELPLLPLWVTPLTTAASDRLQLTYDQYDWDDVHLWTITE